MTSNLSIVNEMTFHSMDAAARTPVGQTAILCAADFAGTVTRITHTNTDYWTVHMSHARDTFRGGIDYDHTVIAHVWRDEKTQRWVTDYHSNDGTVQVAQSRGLAAALSVAAFSVATRGNQANLW